MLNGVNTGINGDIYLSSSLQNGDKINCVYSDNLGCIAGGTVASNSIFISKGTAVSPSLSISAPVTTTCSGSPVTFTAMPSNAGAKPSYQWQVNGNNAGTDSTAFTTTTLNNGDIITCKLNVDPLLTCATSPTATSNNIVMQISGEVQPSVVIKTPQTVICTGNTATFTATAAGAGANHPTKWLVNGTNSGTNDSVYTSAALNDGDIVGCFITNLTHYLHARLHLTLHRIILLYRL